MSTFLLPPPITTELTNQNGKINSDWLNWFNSLAQLSYPVGAYFVTTANATNPNTLLGFGKWASVGSFNASANTVYLWRRSG